MVALNQVPPQLVETLGNSGKLNWWKSRGGAGAVRQSAEDLQRCDNGCSAHRGILLGGWTIATPRA